MSSIPKDPNTDDQTPQPQEFTEDYPNFPEPDETEPKPRESSEDVLPDTIAPGQPVFNRQP